MSTVTDVTCSGTQTTPSRRQERNDKSTLPQKGSDFQVTEEVMEAIQTPGDMMGNLDESDRTKPTTAEKSKYVTPKDFEVLTVIGVGAFGRWVVHWWPCCFTFFGQVRHSTSTCRF